MKPTAVLAGLLLSLIVAGGAIGACFEPGDAPCAVSLVGDSLPPFLYSESDNYITSGVAFDMINAIFRNIPEAHVAFPRMPWKRSLLQMELGDKDGVALIIKTPAREKNLVFSLPYIQADAKVFYNKKRFPNGFSWSSLNDLKGYRVGLIAGHYFGEEVERARKDGTLTIDESTNVDLAFRLLEYRRVDFTIISVPVALASVRQAGWLDDLGIADKVVTTYQFHIGISLNSQARRLIPRINEAIIHLAETGEADEMLVPFGASSPPMDE